jgi:O-antigen/teichoic acid export membrane protein
MINTEEHITAGIERESHPAVRVLAVVWLTGAAVLLGYNLIYWLRFQKKLKRLNSPDFRNAPLFLPPRFLRLSLFQNPLYDHLRDGIHIIFFENLFF